MKQISFFTLIILISTTRVISQTNKFGKINDEHWKINNCVFDSTSKALIIFDVGEISIKEKDDVKNYDSDCKLTIDFFVLNYSRHLRIKILNQKKNSLCFAFFLRTFDKRKDDLKSFKCISQRQENGAISKTKYTRKDLKQVNNENKGYALNLDLSGEKDGSIIDISYYIESNIFTELPIWTFSNGFPTIYSEINYCIPDFFEINKNGTSLNNLSYESSNSEVKYRVSYEVPNGWNDKVYKYMDINEKYSLNNILSQKTNKSDILKFDIRNINFELVYSERQSWIKK